MSQGSEVVRAREGKISDYGTRRDFRGEPYTKGMRQNKTVMPS